MIEITLLTDEQKGILWDAYQKSGTSLSFEEYLGMIMLGLIDNPTI